MSKPIFTMVWVLTALAGPADATLCVEPSPVVYPIPGSTDVPRNPVLVTEVGGPALTLAPAGGAAIPLIDATPPDLVGDFLFWRPVGELDAFETYEVTYTVGGFPGSLTFTTGKSSDTIGPDPLSLDSFTAESAVFGDTNDCLLWPNHGLTGTTITFDFVQPLDTGFVIAELYAKPGLYYGYSLVLGSSLYSSPCLPASATPQLSPDDNICVTLRSYDGAGNATISAEVCEIVASCTVDLNATTCAPERTCTAPVVDPIVDPPPEQLPGGGCNSSGTGGLPLFWLLLPLFCRASISGRRSPSHRSPAA